MKKYLLAALVVLSASTFAANVTVFGGVNMNGELSTEYNGVEASVDSDKIGYTVGVEAHKEIAKFTNGKFEIGLGTKYESSFISDNFDGDTLATTMPIYGSAKVSFNATKSTSVYLQGTLGYAFAFAGDVIKDYDTYLSETYNGSCEIEGGLYTGVGMGLETSNYNIGLNYNITNATETDKAPGYETEKYDFKYSKLSLTAGYKFGK